MATQRFLEFFTPNDLGEMIQISRSFFFQMGWFSWFHHQLEDHTVDGRNPAIAN